MHDAPDAGALSSVEQSFRVGECLRKSKMRRIVEPYPIGVDQSINAAQIRTLAFHQADKTSSQVITKLRHLPRRLRTRPATGMLPRGSCSISAQAVARRKSRQTGARASGPRRLCDSVVVEGRVIGAAPTAS